MLSWFRQVDELLRIRVMPERRIKQSLANLSLRRFALLIAIMAAAYGIFMGLYALSIYWGGTSPAQPQRCWQILASTIKLPAMFLLTLVIPLPSLYVVNAILGCPLSFRSTIRLQVAAVAVNLAVVASLGPILGFLILSTSSYAFMVLINVFLLGIGGLAYLFFMRHVIGQLTCVPALTNGGFEPTGPKTDTPPSEISAADPQGEASPDPQPISSSTGSAAKIIFRIWLLLYCVIGMQMSWVLRPFIGNPDMPFAWFRPREGHFFKAVFLSIQQLLGMH